MGEFTVIGFIDESREAQVAGIVEGSHAVTQDFFDRWCVVVEADTPGKAEDRALTNMERKLIREKEDDNGN